MKLSNRAGAGRLPLLLAAAVATLALGACEAMPTALPPIGGLGGRSVLELRLAEAEARNDALAREVAALRGGAEPGAAAMPAGVEPGRCYAFIGPARTGQRTVITPERQVLRITPAIYEWVDEVVVTREARTEYEVTPAVVETVVENVQLSPGYTERTVMPALYEDVAESAAVREAYVQFEPCDAADGGDSMCAVEHGAQMGSATRRVMTQPERVRETEIPARYMRVTREVVVEPAKLVTREIPAETETIRVQRLVSPAREETVTLPAVYAEAETDVAQAAGAAGEAASGWVEVLCDTRETRPVLVEIQRALAAAGYDPGSADGVFGPKTRAALEAYQREQGLPAGHLTRATAERLGVAWE